MLNAWSFLENFIVKLDLGSSLWKNLIIFQSIIRAHMDIISHILNTPIINFIKLWFPIYVIIYNRLYKSSECSFHFLTKIKQLSGNQVLKYRRNLILWAYLTNRKKLKNRMSIQISNTIAQIRDYNSLRRYISKVLSILRNWKISHGMEYHKVNSYDILDYRSNSWKILLKYMSTNIDNQEQSLQRKRNDYFRMVDTYI